MLRDSLRKPQQEKTLSRLSSGFTHSLLLEALFRLRCITQLQVKELQSPHPDFQYELLDCLFGLENHTFNAGCIVYVVEFRRSNYRNFLRQRTYNFATL